MDTREITAAILEELGQTLSQVDPEETEAMIDAILGAKRIFVAGAGRSLLMMRGFAMRLMHMGFQSYVVGETVTPAITREDLLLIGSGSGETDTLKVMAKKAKDLGAKLGLISIFPDSTIGQLADYVIRVKAATTKGTRSTVKSIQPGANTFEQSLLLIGDALIIRIISRCKISGENEKLMQRHANLE